MEGIGMNIAALDAEEINAIGNIVVHLDHNDRSSVVIDLCIDVG